MKNKEVAALLKTIGENFLALSNIYSSSEDDFPLAEESPSETVSSSVETETTAEPKAESESKAYTKEEVRALLAQKAKADEGIYKAQVKAIVSKYSADGTLTKVPQEKYPELVADLEVVGNG